eukprot:TRINITY_DN11208_c0_g1_i1.p1 TRINITY_DN11208_c0_g1~~TRINITY_DN11208_c0_g1_i1.p1  ORF type:complete len:679 (+),score=167.11 TRINITY_DN11208_c0_g1_i1:23-2059(+)
MEQASHLISISVLRAIQVRDWIKNQHTEYIIEVSTKYKKWAIHKRFKELYNLHYELLSKYRSQDMAPFPDKKMFGVMDVAFVESRRIQLEAYLRYLISNGDLLLSKEFQDFVGKPPDNAVRIKKMSDQVRPTNPQADTANGGSPSPVVVKEAGFHGAMVAELQGRRRSQIGAAQRQETQAAPAEQRKDTAAKQEDSVPKVVANKPSESVLPKKPEPQQVSTKDKSSFFSSAVFSKSLSQGREDLMARSDKKTSEDWEIVNLGYSYMEDEHTSMVPQGLYTYMKSEPKNAFSGVTKGVLNLTTGIMSGVKGIVMDPINGAVNDGGAGFFRGVGTGVAGAIRKPIVGVADLGFQTAVGIRNNFQNGFQFELSFQEDEGLEELLALAAQNKPKFNFGEDLKASLERAQKRGLPHVTDNIINNLSSLQVMEEEGLFRLSGRSVHINTLKNELSEDDDLDLSEEGVHDLTGLLKLYFRMLPEPLCTFDAYPKFIEAAGYLEDTPVCCARMRDVIATLPAHNKELLEKLMKFLHQVQKHQDKNKMGPSNLSLVFTPNIIYPGRDGQGQVVSSMDEIVLNNSVIEFMIANYPDVFEEKRHRASSALSASQKAFHGAVRLPLMTEQDLRLSATKRRTLSFSSGSAQVGGPPLLSASMHSVSLAEINHRPNRPQPPLRAKTLPKSDD